MNFHMNGDEQLRTHTFVRNAQNRILVPISLFSLTAV